MEGIKNMKLLEIGISFFSFRKKVLVIITLDQLYQSEIESKE